MKKLIFLLIILSFSSCRYNNYTPSEPDSIYDFEGSYEVFFQPKKGDIYYLGDEITIEYRVFSNSNFVDLYAEKKGSILFLIAKNVRNNGTFIWKTNSEMIPSVHYQIRIVNPTNKDIYALSDSFGIISK